MRRALVIVGVLVAAALVAVLPRGIGDQGAVAPSPGGPGGSGSPAGPVARPATVLQSVVPRWAPDGRHITDEGGQNDEALEAGRAVTVLEGPVVAGVGQWVKVFVLASQNAYPGDFVAWLPVAQDERPVLEIGTAVPCPEALTLETIARLAPVDRLRCAGGKVLELDARTGFAVDYVAYAVDPAWYGGSEDRSVTVSLSTGGGALRLVPDDRVAWIDAQTAPGVDRLPLDFDVRVTGQFDHPSAMTCRRTVDAVRRPAGVRAGSGLPDESPEDSVAWCRGRFVITGWTPVAGPERRPVVQGEVQLHRIAGGNACAGVGMGPLRFRIDPEEADPIWLEQGEAGRGRIIPLFSPAFHVVTDPVLAVADASGAVIEDGTPVNPDADFHGHFVCPMGDVVSFN